jgi:hypothetical protein
MDILCPCDLQMAGKGIEDEDDYEHEDEDGHEGDYEHEHEHEHEPARGGRRGTIIFLRRPRLRLRSFPVPWAAF